MDTKVAQYYSDLEILDSHMPALDLNSTAQHGILPALSLTCSNVQVSTGHLVVSPYGGPSHLLDLSTVSKPNQILAQALALLQPVRSDYATAPYVDSFNWATVIELLIALLRANNDFEWQSEAFYIIVFRSQIPLTTDRSHLFALDELSHAEAMESGGLLKYWFGVPDSEGRNLATCIWRAREDAKRAGSRPGHAQAMKATSSLYTEWKVERLKLVVGEGIRDWHIVKWQD